MRRACNVGAAQRRAYNRPVAPSYVGAQRASDRRTPMCIPLRPYSSCAALTVGRECRLPYDERQKVESRTNGHRGTATRRNGAISWPSRRSTRRPTCASSARWRAASDVDFLVDLEPGRSLFDLGGLLMDLQALLEREVDVATPGGLKPRIRERVLRESVRL